MKTQGEATYSTSHDTLLSQNNHPKMAKLNQTPSSSQGSITPSQEKRLAVLRQQFLPRYTVIGVLWKTSFRYFIHDIIDDEGDPFERLSAEKEGNWVFSGAYFHFHGVGRTSPRLPFSFPPPKPWSWPSISLWEEWEHPLLSASPQGLGQLALPLERSPSFLVSSWRTCTEMGDRRTPSPSLPT